MDRNLNGQSPSQHPRTGLLPMDGGAKARANAALAAADAREPIGVQA